MKGALLTSTKRKLSLIEDEKNIISTCLSNRKKQVDVRTIIHTRIFTSEIPLVLILPIGIPYTKKSKYFLCVTAGS